MRSLLQNTRNIDYVRFNLTLVRHAETHANSEGIIQGSIDTELSNIGYLQSEALGRYLQCHRFSHIYSSDLKRASETAQRIRLFNQVSTCEIQYDALLRERMYGIAQGRTRQWLRELAKESGVPYANFTPPGAESPNDVRERGIKFFRKLCEELLENFGAKASLQKRTFSALEKTNSDQEFPYSSSSGNLSSPQTTSGAINRQRSLSTGSLEAFPSNSLRMSRSSRTSIDSALDLSSLSSDQQSISSSSSVISRNSSFEKQRNLANIFFQSPYKNHFSNVDVLLVSHGAVIRELIKYFACDLQTDIGEHFDTIQEIAPNTSVTRFEVTYKSNYENSQTSTSLNLVDYHKKTHLTKFNNDDLNLDVVNKCNL